ncbi:MAG TPA: ABC transporter substrate-binding protein [Candidatus Binatia bacterium]|jgi:putative ABC transport system substrate-binding protein
MIAKRAVITLVILILIFVHVAEAQTKKIPRVGWLSVGHGPRVNPHFRWGMRELGWLNGQNFVVETRFAREKYDQLPKLAAELVQLKVDVIVTADAPAITAAKNATRAIPIVMAIAGDPVSRGYLASFARPGGNITGLSNDLGPLDGKRLQLLKEAIGTVARVAIFDPTGLVDWKMMENVSRALGIELHKLPRFKRSDELEIVFQATRTTRVNGLLVAASAWTNLHRNKIIKFASQYRLPAIYPTPIYVADGGLMSYGPNNAVLFRRAAYYVDKILKGTKPSDLPVERPMAAKLSINLKTAKEAGLKIQPEVLQRADKVIR